METAAFVLSCVVLLWNIVNAVLVHHQDKEISKLNARLDINSHIVNYRFDEEYRIYCELMENLGNMLNYNLQLYPYGLYYESADERKRIEDRKELYINSIKTYNEFYSVLFKYSAFIDNDINDLFLDICKKCKLQIEYYYDFMISDDKTILNDSLKQFRECQGRTPEIFNDGQSLTKKLRKYIQQYNSGREGLKNAK